MLYLMTSPNIQRDLRIKSLSRVVALKNIRKVTAIYMHVYFRSCDALMSQHLLDSTDISSILKQVRCKGMPKCMGADFFLDPGLFP